MCLNSHRSCTRRWACLVLLSFALISSFPIHRCLADNGHPSSVTLNSYLPTNGSSNSVTMESPNQMFQLIVITWSSPSGRYCMAGVDSTKVGEHPMMWAANDGEPFELSSNQSCRFHLSDQGDLLLEYDGNKTAWRSGTGGTGVSNLTLSDDGNLALITDQGSLAWQSFQQPSVFALMSGMNFTSNMTLVSSADFQGAPSTVNVPGGYAMQLLDQTRLALLTGLNDSFHPFVYWSSSIPGLSAASTTKASYVTLDDAFTFHANASKALGSILPSTDVPSAFSTYMKTAIIDPLSADLVAFYWNNGSWFNFFNSSINPCANPTHCGEFSLCNDVNGDCTCPQGFTQEDNNCELDAELAAELFTCPGNESAESYTFRSFNVTFAPQFSPISAGSVENCRFLCAEDCRCRAALFDPDTSSCSLFSTLQTVTSNKDSKQLLLMKVGLKKASSKHIAIVIGATCATIAILFLVVSVLILLRLKKRRESASDDEQFLQELPRLPTRYTYRELHAVTNGFTKKLGEGGFGSVYEGILPSGSKVAVKKLENAGKQSFAQFRSEVASIGIASHMNLVTLLGFCHAAEGKLLVYEYMPMGSLDAWLFGEEHDLGWRRRCKIALDAARGLAYLHGECGQKVVHCDIKPENILLDEKFNAKLGDFGLAKLIEEDRQSFNMTTLKGTRGYLAPEWLQEAVITARSDVYSYGVVLLELVSGRRCLGGDLGYLPTTAFRIASESASTCSSEMPLPWVSSSDGLQASDSIQTSLRPPMCVEDTQIFCSKMDVLLDGRLAHDTDVTPLAVQRMVYIALWCLQPDPTVRPPMSMVVQMLEGTMDVPPPFLQSTSSSKESPLALFSSMTFAGTSNSESLTWTVMGKRED
ncbi:hypothetical protein KP509_20G063500 [Ceratopteris richardii]|uniref:Receptor-like serine/threonine-protein kinase n=1 Tax=Ceratopteris richardii TaxID=49495 RepID=A0A8T2SHP2_CERRI|nr:hypothetical protein KP509_20G063500 [Ceratopteris richardii]